MLMAKHKLRQEVINVVQLQFSASDRNEVVALLQSLADDVNVGEHESILHRTCLGVLKLANGNREQCKYYIKLALEDYRDILFQSE